MDRRSISHKAWGDCLIEYFCCLDLDSGVSSAALKQYETSDSRCSPLHLSPLGKVKGFNVTFPNWDRSWSLITNRSAGPTESEGCVQTLLCHSQSQYRRASQMKKPLNTDTVKRNLLPTWVLLRLWSFSAFIPKDTNIPVLVMGELFPFLYSWQIWSWKYTYLQLEIYLFWSATLWNVNCFPLFFDGLCFDICKKLTVAFSIPPNILIILILSNIILLPSQLLPFKLIKPNIFHYSNAKVSSNRFYVSSRIISILSTLCVWSCCPG